LPFRRARTFAAAPKRTANLVALNERLSPEASVPSNSTAPLVVSRRMETQVLAVAVTSRRAPVPGSAGAVVVVVAVVVVPAVVAGLVLDLVVSTDVDVSATVLLGAVVGVAGTAPSVE
jgi:hypothetical protein